MIICTIGQSHMCERDLLTLNVYSPCVFNLKCTFAQNTLNALHV